MLLQRLKEYADTRMKMPPTLYSEAPVRYIIELDRDGTLRTRRPTDTAGTDAKTKRGQRRVVPQVQRGVGIKPLLLADNAEYTLGLAREDSRPERVDACHRAYLDLLETCRAATGDPLVEAVCTFLSNAPVTALDLADDFDRGATITFSVWDGPRAEFVVERQAVKAFWAAENDPAAKGATVLQCIVCGQERPVLDRLQGKVKGVPGGQTSGTSIISANADAFESYGLKASLIAPTCADCGERFTKAVNALLAEQASRIVIGRSAFIFWTREQVEFSFRDFLDNPKPEEVRELIASVRSGRRREVDATAFYAISLSGSGGRAAVRDWIDTTVGGVQRSLARWFDLQEIVDAYGQETAPLGIYRLAAATVRDAKDIAPPTPRALLRGALLGDPVPQGLLAQAVRRGRAGQGVVDGRTARACAGLIKLVLASNTIIEGDSMVQLNPSHDSAAYQCGRLLAVLERIQQAALGDINATIVDRFYGTASSAPMSVFSRLLRGAQPHLAVLRRDRPGAFRANQEKLESILGAMSGFPAVLDLSEQGLFALGYYHQRAHDRAQAREAGERRRAGLAAQDAPDADTDDAAAAVTDSSVE